MSHFLHTTLSEWILAFLPCFRAKKPLKIKGSTSHAKSMQCMKGVKQTHNHFPLSGKFSHTYWKIIDDNQDWNCHATSNSFHCSSVRMKNVTKEKRMFLSVGKSDLGVKWKREMNGKFIFYDVYDYLHHTDVHKLIDDCYYMSNWICIEAMFALVK